MRILYGVVGEGLGHAMRSRVVIEYLLRAGHELSITASGRATDFLQKRFAGVKRIHGLHIIYEENRVRVAKTLLSNAIAGAAGVPRNIAAYFDLLRAFRPELVISDFESWAYLFAKTHALPVISVDNNQIVNRCRHDRDIIDGEEQNFEIARAFVKSKLPFCAHYVITTFFYPPVRRANTTLVPPILRPEILDASPARGDHLLVYQTAEGNETLAEVLRATGVECRIYGMRRSLEREEIEANLRYRPFSESAFIADLATSRAVVAGGGFTTLCEAVFLRKPILTFPVEGQFEQVLNARYVQKLGYGQLARRLDAETVAAFIGAIPEFEKNLAAYTQEGNRVLYETLEGLLDRAEAGVL